MPLIGAGAGGASSLLSTGQPCTDRTCSCGESSCIGDKYAYARDACTSRAANWARGSCNACKPPPENPTVRVDHHGVSQALGAYGRQQIPTASGTSVPRADINSSYPHLLANTSEALPESESICRTGLPAGGKRRILNRSRISGAAGGACAFSSPVHSCIKVASRRRRIPGDGRMDA